MTNTHIRVSEIGLRTFINPRREKDGLTSPDSEFNLEYRIRFNDIVDYRVERTGGVLGTTGESHHYEITGEVIIRPADKGTVEGVFIDYVLGEKHGSGVEASNYSHHTSFKEGGCQRVHLDQATDLFWIRGHFPEMVADGAVVLASLTPFPGDTSQEVFAALFKEALGSSKDFHRYSRAHNAFLKEYLRHEEVE